MKLIIGLGNPGDKYKDTRHNIGFTITGELAQKHDIQGKTETKFNALVGKGTIGREEVLIVQPLTFMNLSGQALSKLLHWYKISPDAILVVYDDISLDLGRIRFRKSGSNGGHNGIKSIIESLGGFKDFDRLKIGVGPDPGGAVRASFVLGKFSKDEKEIIKKLIPICIESIETYLNENLEKASNSFNSINLSIN